MTTPDETQQPTDEPASDEQPTEVTDQEEQPEQPEEVDPGPTPEEIAEQQAAAREELLDQCRAGNHPGWTEGESCTSCGIGKSDTVELTGTSEPE